MKKKNLLSLPILIDKDEDNVWFAVSPVLKWLNTQWDNLDELQEHLEEASSLYFDMIKDWEKPFTSKYFMNITYNENGKITNNISKEINQNITKELISA